MTKAIVTFRRCHQNSQDYGSDDEHMVSRVFFDLTINGKEYADCYADIKQTVGSDFNTAPLEVTEPHGYSGPFNFARFREHAEEYYRKLIGWQGSVIHVQGAAHLSMKDNWNYEDYTVSFDIGQSGLGW